MMAFNEKILLKIIVFCYNYNYKSRLKRKSLVLISDSIFNFRKF